MEARATRITREEKKELDVLSRYVPRIVLSNYIASRAKLEAPAIASFTAVVALFDISGFSTLADRLAREETHRAPVPTGAEAKSRMSMTGKLDISRSASHRRVSTASDKVSLRIGHDVDDTAPSSDKRGSIVGDKASFPERHNSTGDASAKKSMPARAGMAVEQLTRHLNQTLAPVIDIITEHNGDIIKFAGDAMIVMWETESSAPRTDSTPLTPVDHGLLVHTAILCALKVLGMLRGQPAGSHRLGMHVGMGLSTVTGNHVGGLLNRWEFYVAGHANQQMSMAEHDAGEGELVVSSECYHALVASAAIENLAVQSTVLLTGNYRIDSLESNTPRVYPTRPLELSGDLIPLIKSYVPGCISLSLGKGKLVINGMRSITAIFIKFSEILTITDPQAQLLEVHRCLCAVQDAAYRVHATIRQFLIDDKGAVAIVIVGLPPFYHENNALHGIRMALYLQEKGVKACIGITSGPAFCGSIGSAVRAEYAVVGDTINLSARLMSVALPGQILCDEATQSATTTLFEFDQGSPVLVKGKGTTITVFRVFRDANTDNKAHPLDHGEIFLSPDIYVNVIKRVQAFAARFQSTDSSHMPSEQLDPLQKRVVLLRGLTGVGKSCLLRHLTKVHPNVVYAAGDSVEKNTPLYIWKKLMSTIICGTNRVKAHRVEESDAGFVVLGRRLSVLDHNNNASRSPNGSGQTLATAGSMRSLPPTVSGSARALTQNTLARGVSWRTNTLAPSPSGRMIDVIVVNTEKSRLPGAVVTSKNSGNNDDDDNDDDDDDGDDDDDDDDDDANADRSRVESLVSAVRIDQSIALGSGLAFVNSVVQSGSLSPELLPLLNFFIPHCFPENNYTLALAANKDALLKELIVMVVAILQQASMSRPLLFVVDDAQWVDGQSWDLLTTAASVSSNIAVVVAHRTDAAPSHDAFKKLEMAPLTFRYELSNLSLRDTSLFLSHRYGIAIMNSYLLEFVHGRAHGNPRDTITLMERLLEVEAIEIDVTRGVCHVHKDVHEVDMEVSVQTRAKVMYHYDSLSMISQLALRIASVGLEYVSLDCLSFVLRTVFQLEADSSFAPKASYDGSVHSGGSTRLLAQTVTIQALSGLGPLEAAGILKLDKHNETIEYTSSEARTVVYNVMLPSQREVIHKVFANWFEYEVPSHRLPRFQYYSHLAYHQSRCRMYTDAMDHYCRGAEEALLRGVSDYALTCLTSAGDVLALTDATLGGSGSSGRHLALVGSSDRHAARRLSRLSRGPSLHFASNDERITLHQCKIEYLTGLVMVQKSEWTAAIEHFQATVAIYEHLVSGRPKPTTWRIPAFLHFPRFSKLLFCRSSPVGPFQHPPTTALADQVEAYVRVAKALAAQIVAAEAAREKASNAIRLLGLRSIFSAKPPSGTTSEATFVAFLPGRKPRQKLQRNIKMDLSTEASSRRKLPIKLLSQSHLFSSKRGLLAPAVVSPSDDRGSTKIPPSMVPPSSELMDQRLASTKVAPPLASDVDAALAPLLPIERRAPV
ncbi:hypothetical protein SPRG_02471 [Saprolegnia parasitica CBS 223.65]|uniref:Guanylate cyclase domain-containing protein n=1 Tax=Saprolegnia parasitica (strain CBS 223.65) TaxID=695850 RepID=A0A067CQK8_SAPPC|nr:hypothetical protein SPRG_02471 [Saprolegnia parasitica CBS 223.65]KDO32773.1 hypothetical protein SPRG_02471 [Saprolegnia parasitica CBS 223.65]|eukprot:XP_012196437.1 hypothetical protein SPRG_02471 [Saprolegnia parasitica CBS 223.65]